jgi:hypothetical protein
LISGIFGALFYDTGNVFPQVTDIRLSQFTHSVGFGLLLDAVDLHD